MKKFKPLAQQQRFYSAMGEIYDHFEIGRHNKTTAKVYRILLNRSFELWRTIAPNSPIHEVEHEIRIFAFVMS